MRLNLGKSIESAIARLARQSGRTKTSLIREALVRHLEDVEDAKSAMRARKHGGRTRTIAEIRRLIDGD